MVLTFFRPGDLVWVTPAREQTPDIPGTVIAIYLTFVTVRTDTGRVMILNRSRVKWRNKNE